MSSKSEPKSQKSEKKEEIDCSISFGEDCSIVTPTNITKTNSNLFENTPSKDSESDDASPKQNIKKVDSLDTLIKNVLSKAEEANRSPLSYYKTK